MGWGGHPALCPRSADGAPGLPVPDPPGRRRSRERCGGGGKGLIQPRERAGGSGGPGPTVCAPPRSARACSCGGCRWWGGTTATPSGLRCRPCTTSTRRWIISSSCRAAATASSPAWGSSAVRARGLGLPGGWGCCHPPVPAPSVPTGPFYPGNPGVESKIAPFWVMPPPEVSGGGFGVGCPRPAPSGAPQGGVRSQSRGVTPPWLPHPPATAQRLRHPHGCGGDLHPGRVPHQRRRAGDGERGVGAPKTPEPIEGRPGPSPLIPVLPLAPVMGTVPSPAPPGPPRSRCRRFGVPVPGFGAPPGPAAPLSPPRRCWWSSIRGPPTW